MRSSIVGESKTPDALRNASNRFFEWTRPEPQVQTAPASASKEEKAALASQDSPQKTIPKPVPKQRPRMIVDAVELLARDASEGKVGLGALGQYLKRTDPDFSPKIYWYATLLNMIKTYYLLLVKLENDSH